MTLQNDTSSTVNSPNLINATLRGKYITLQFDNVLSDTLPSTRKFTLNQGNRQYQIIDSEIRSSEGVVTLTAEKELDPTVQATLDYLDFAGDQNVDVIESDDGILAIGSGGPYANSAAKALMKNTKMNAKEIAEESLNIAADICIYTNHNIISESIEL